MRINISARGLDSLRRNMRRYPEISRRQLKLGINKVGFAIERNTKRQSVYQLPVVTGTLKRSVKYKPRHKAGYIAAGAVVASVFAPGGDYAVFVHEGTRFMRPRPFLITGAKRAQRDVERILEDTIEDIAREITR